MKDSFGKVVLSDIFASASTKRKRFESRDFQLFIQIAHCTRSSWDINVHSTLILDKIVILNIIHSILKCQIRVLKL